MFGPVNSVRYAVFFAMSLMTAVPVRGGNPRIFYSDLDSGPNSGGEKNGGAYVTIYGKGFGATQGASFVTIGAGRAVAYPVWTDSKIAFQIGASAVSTLGENASQQLIYFPRNFLMDCSSRFFS